MVGRTLPCQQTPHKLRAASRAMDGACSAITSSMKREGLQRSGLPCRSAQPPSPRDCDQRTCRSGSPAPAPSWAVRPPCCDLSRQGEHQPPRPSGPSPMILCGAKPDGLNELPWQLPCSWNSFITRMDRARSGLQPCWLDIWILPVLSHCLQAVAAAAAACSAAQQGSNYEFTANLASCFVQARWGCSTGKEQALSGHHDHNKMCDNH